MVIITPALMRAVNQQSHLCVYQGLPIIVGIVLETLFYALDPDIFWRQTKEQRAFLLALMLSSISMLYQNYQEVLAIGYRVKEINQTHFQFPTMKRLETHCKFYVLSKDQDYPNKMCQNLYAGIKLRFELMCCHAYYFLNYIILWALLVWLTISPSLFNDQKINTYSFFILFPTISFSFYDQFLLICGVFVEFPRRILQHQRKKRQTQLLLQDESIDCSICLEEISLSATDVSVLVCHPKHAFHTVCLNSWRQQHTTCPHCRSNIQVKT